MRFPILVPVLLASFALAGCSGTATHSYSFTPPSTPGGRLCSDQCQQARGYCQETCDLRDRACVDNAQASALRDYDKYTRAQFAKHQPFELLPRDFENDAPCATDKTSCYGQCEDDYSACYRNCGGKVSVVTSCRFMCF